MELYGLRILRDDRDKKAQSKRHLVFFVVYAAIMTSLCRSMINEEAYFVCVVVQGYVAYRTWAYIDART